MGSLSTGMPRPLSCTSAEPSACRVTSTRVQTPASASSTELSMISHRQCTRPRESVEPMYMPGPLADRLEALEDQQVLGVVGVVDDGSSSQWRVTGTSRRAAWSSTRNLLNATPGPRQRTRPGRRVRAASRVMEARQPRLHVTNLQIPCNTGPRLPMMMSGLRHTRASRPSQRSWKLGRAGRSSRDWMLSPVTDAGQRDSSELPRTSRVEQGSDIRKRGHREHCDSPERDPADCGRPLRPLRCAGLPARVPPGRRRAPLLRPPRPRARRQAPRDRGLRPRRDRQARRHPTSATEDEH